MGSSASRLIFVTRHLVAVMVFFIATPTFATVRDVNIDLGIFGTFTLQLFNPGGGPALKSDGVEFTNAKEVAITSDRIEAEKNWEWSPIDDPLDALKLPLAIFSNLDLFGTGEILARGRTDPWAAFKVSFTNDRDVSTQIFYQGNFGTTVMTGDNHVEALLDVSVEDSSGDGAASYETNFAMFEAWYFPEFVFMTFPGAEGPGPDLNVNAGETVRQVNASGTINPGDFFGTQFNELSFTSNGIISPGDTVILTGFTCIVPAGDSCPVPPVLDAAVVPLPGALWMFGPALMVFGLRAKKWTRHKLVQLVS